jgi:coatomer subunit beta'
MTFEGHTHFVMQVCFNPKDGNTFASASMDRTVKVLIRSHVWFGH